MKKVIKRYSKYNITDWNSGKDEVRAALMSEVPDSSFKEPVKAKKFRLNRKDVFLTYPQILPSMTCEWFLSRLSKIAEIDEYVIAKEPHKKGGEHVHIYIKFEQKVDVKNANFFDLYYYGKAYHPNVTGPKNKDRIIAYITKGKEYIHNCEIRPNWQVILDECESWEDFYTAILLDGASYRSYVGWRALNGLMAAKIDNKVVDKSKEWHDQWKKKRDDDTTSLNKE